MNDQTTLYQGESALPPPGDARQEILKERKDDLQQRGETMAGQLDLNAIDPSKIQPEREILSLIDSLQVNQRQPAYEYKWVQDKWPSNASALEVRRTLAIHVRVNGAVRPAWEIVKGDMPEAPELKDVLGTRRLGDCVLMRCRKDIYALLQQREKLKRDQRVLGVTAGLDEIGEYAGRVGGGRTGHGAYERSKVMDSLQSKNIAGQQFDNMVREGNIPGAPAPDNWR